MIGNFLGYFEKPHSYVKTALATFWATFGEKNWATFFSNIGSHCLRRVHNACSIRFIFIIHKSKAAAAKFDCKSGKVFFLGGGDLKMKCSLSKPLNKR